MGAYQGQYSIIHLCTTNDNRAFLSGLVIKDLLEALLKVVEAFNLISYAKLDIDSAQAESMSKGINEVVILAPQK